MWGSVFDNATFVLSKCQNDKCVRAAVDRVLAELAAFAGWSSTGSEQRIMNTGILSHLEQGPGREGVRPPRPSLAAGLSAPLVSGSLSAGIEKHSARGSEP
jgi:hypothetical protein